MTDQSDQSVAYMEGQLADAKRRLDAADAARSKAVRTYNAIHDELMILRMKADPHDGDTHG